MGILKKAKKAAKNLYKSAKSTVSDAYHAVGDVFDITGQVLQGDVGGVGREFADLTRHTSGAVLGYAETVSGVGAASGGKISDVAANASAALTAYGTGNFARGSDYVETATGSDVFGRQAKREAKAEAAAAEAEAKAAATAERKAQLLGLKKQLVPAVRGSSAAGSAVSENVSGIVLG